MSHYNLCIKDLYLIFLTIIIFYLLYCNICSKKEGFAASDDIKAAIGEVYNADIEAIRNLSSIAKQLMTTQNLTIPGDLSITNNLYVKSSDPAHQVQIGTSQIKFKGDGKAHYALTNDSTDGKFKISNSSGNGELGKGFVNDCMTIDTTGNTTIAGALQITTGNITGNIVTTGNIVANGTICAKKPLFYQKITVTANKAYIITHNLGLPIQLYTIKILASNGTDPEGNAKACPGGCTTRWDITGQLVNYSYNQGYSIQDLDNNCFQLWISNFAMTVSYIGNTYAARGADYEIYLI
jgi:hypothetical protein